jgi:hypothetical protein
MENSFCAIKRKKPATLFASFQLKYFFVFTRDFRDLHPQPLLKDYASASGKAESSQMQEKSDSRNMRKIRRIAF